jgi:hypothetical protein
MRCWKQRRPRWVRGGGKYGWLAAEVSEVGGGGQCVYVGRVCACTCGQAGRGAGAGRTGVLLKVGEVLQL